MLNPIQISAKSLGQLALANFCPKCFWVRLHCHDKFPFAIFPGIFSSIDSYSKKVTAAHFATHGRVPRWFDGFGEIGVPIKVPHWSKFNVVDKSTNITLTGMPDELLQRRDNSLFIGDYKCARYTDRADELLPMYSVQLNVYAYIAKQTAVGTASGLGLLYYEPAAALPASDTDDLIKPEGFLMRFTAKVLPIPLNVKAIPPLLARVREIHDLTCAPAGREGCKDCALLEALVAVAAQGVQQAELLQRNGGR